MNGWFLRPVPRGDARQFKRLLERLDDATIRVQGPGIQSGGEPVLRSTLVLVGATGA